MTLLRLAGALQILVAAANLPLARVLRLREEHTRLSPLVRQIHEVHHAYVMGVLVLFGAASLAFPAELADGGLGRFLSGAIALFWGARLVLQRAYYDRAALRQHRAADLAFTLVFAGLAATYAAAALGGLR